MIQLFQKKTDELWARQWDGSLDSLFEIQHWVDGFEGAARLVRFPDRFGITVKTREGSQLHLRMNEWLVRPDGGAFSVCADFMFAATYDPV